MARRADPGDHPVEHFRGFAGILRADAYAGCPVGIVVFRERSSPKFRDGPEVFFTVPGSRDHRVDDKAANAANSISKAVPMTGRGA